MSIPAGARLGPYEILAPLGAGAMGEVYRAHDPRLGREVALKLLPADTTHDPAARARLVREARLAAALNHPNICTVYEVGEADGRVYLALELIDGQPLSALITHRPTGLATENVVGYGAQIAEALAHAHERHVIHRDLKASNVMVTRDGRVKVLDFGVARRGQPDAADAPTAALTRPGAVVGTPQYLAPEVLDGGEADERSDLWALGVLLFELASGALPFRGATSFALASSILHDPPAPLPERVPGGLRGVIARCLAKAPGERYQRAGEVRAALAAIADHGAPTPFPPSPGAAATRRGWLAPAAVLALAVALAALWYARREPRAPGDLEQRQLTSSPVDEGALGVISPDGKTVAVGNLNGLSLRSVETGESHAVELPAGFSFTPPFVSVAWFPDGSRLLVSGRMGDGRLAAWGLPIAGGGMERLLDDATCAVPSPDGAHIAYVRQRGPGGKPAEIWVCGPRGEDAHRVAGDDTSGVIPAWAVWSPTGRRLVYARYNAVRRSTTPRLESCDLSGRIRVVYDPPPDRALHYFTIPIWTRDGRLIFGLTDPPPNERDMNLWSLRVDPSSGAPAGAPRRITQWQRLALVVPTAVSADGRRLTVDVIDYQSDVYVGRITGPHTMLADTRRLTLDERMDLAPTWMPDDSTLLFCSDRNGTMDIFRQRLGETTAEPVVTGPGDQYSPWASADGAWILYREDATAGRGTAARAPGAPGHERLMRVPAHGGRAETVLEASALSGFRLPRASGASPVLCELEPGAVVFTAFDPARGRGRELWRTAGKELPPWDLSPDGSTLAVVVAGPDSWPRIRLVPIAADGAGGADRADAPAREVRIDRPLQIMHLAYAADGHSWTAVEAAEKWGLVRIDADGRTTALLPPQLWMYSSSASPDGKWLAYTSNTGQGGVWLLEDF